MTPPGWIGSRESPARRCHVGVSPQGDLWRAVRGSAGSIPVWLTTSQSNAINNLQSESTAIARRNQTGGSGTYESACGGFEDDPQTSVSRLSERSKALLDERTVPPSMRAM